MFGGVELKIPPNWIAVIASGRHLRRLGLFGMGVLLYLLSAGLHYAALAAEEAREAERRAAEARTLAREAELHALCACRSTRTFCSTACTPSPRWPPSTARAPGKCASASPASCAAAWAWASRESIPLREELALARSYLEVEQVRFGARLRVEEEIEESCEDCAVPALLLQPLVENAVKHGIAGLVEGGAIRLAVRRSGASVPSPWRTPSTPKRPRRPTGWAWGCPRAPPPGGALWRGCQPSSRRADGVYRVVLRLPCESPMASSSRA
jgi:two-component system sensor histidine kinase AlgZ